MWNLGIAQYSHSLDTDVVAVNVRLSQDVYEVVDELRRTVSCSCNHRLGHGINLSGMRKNSSVEHFFKSDLCIPVPGICTIGDSFATLERCVVLVWPHLHKFWYKSGKKTPIPRRNTLSPGTAIKLNYLPDIAENNAFLHTALSHHYVTGGVWRMMDNTSRS